MNITRLPHVLSKNMGIILVSKCDFELRVTATISNFLTYKNTQHAPVPLTSRSIFASRLSHCHLAVWKTSDKDLQLIANFTELCCVPPSAWSRFSRVFCFCEGLWIVGFERCCINKPLITYWGPGTSCHCICCTHFVMIQIKHCFHCGGLLHHSVAHLVERFTLQNAINLTKLRYV